MPPCIRFDSGLRRQENASFKITGGPWGAYFSWTMRSRLIPERIRLLPQRESFALRVKRTPLNKNAMTKKVTRASATGFVNSTGMAKIKRPSGR